MSWHNQIHRELDQIAARGTLPQGPATLSLDAPHGRLHCELTAIDAIGCAFTHVALSTHALSGISANDLRQLGDALTQRLHYLLEPISPLELDAEGFTLQLRSHPPQQEDDGRSYYELIARRGGEIRLCRYRKTPGQPRQMVPAHVTREVLCRLALDLDAAVAPWG